jgi:hypothetical protein
VWFAGRQLKNADTDNVVRLQALTAASMKFRLLWDVQWCSHVEVDSHFEVHNAAIIRAMNHMMNAIHRPDYGGSTHL